MNESFIYLWYDAPNKMFYLGKHKGSPDDTYTHSSTIWESFTKDNIPEGVTREILGEGTDEEMCILEHKLLVEAKNGGDWDRYYNESLGDPRYVDMSGENNPMWKGGISLDVTKYRAMPENKLRQKEYGKKHKQSSKNLAYEQTPERITYKKAYQKERYLRKKAESQGGGTLEAHLK